MFLSFVHYVAHVNQGVLCQDGGRAMDPGKQKETVREYSENKSDLIYEVLLRPTVDELLESKGSL